MIRIEGLTDHQCMIADKLWAAETWDEAESIIRQHGQEGETVQTLIMLACIDNEVLLCDQFPMVERILRRISKNC